MIATPPLTDGFTASPQIDPGDLPALKAQGFVLLVNNRPDDEVPPSHQSDMFAAAAKAAGLAYVAIPVSSGFSPEAINAMAEALRSHEGPVFAWCRSGSRSTYLWALAQASLGVNPDSLIAAATRCGHDLRSMAPILANLAGNLR